MKKSVWKLKTNILNINKKKDLKIKNKQLYISFNNINKYVQIYNGFNFIRLFINDLNMVGKKYGEFVSTRKVHIFKKKEKKKKK